MAPVVAALRERPQIDTRVLATGQHGRLLKQALHAFGIKPDAEIAPSRAAGTLDVALAHLLAAIGDTIERERPRRLVVHGDTLTTLAATLSAHLRGIPVAHVEAGLRSGDLSAPWPEEGSRRVTGVLADLHFAPTAAAAAALRGENVPAAAIHMTGNTVVDALGAIRARIAADPALTAAVEPVLARFAGKRIVTVTCTGARTTAHRCMRSPRRSRGSRRGTTSASWCRFTRTRRRRSRCRRGCAGATASR